MLVPMVKKEAPVEKRLRAKVVKLGGKCLKIIAIGYRGFPDRIILLPGPMLLFVELKKPKGGVLSPNQKKWFELLDRFGFRVLIINTEAKVDALIEQLTDELRILNG